MRHLIVAALFVTGCGNSGNLAIAVTDCQYQNTANGTNLIVGLANSEECPYGGVIIQQGTCKAQVACNGAPGVNGVDGKDGLPGEQGPVGAAGPKGDRGSQGQQGQQGPQGIPGPIGLTGITGPIGATGATGATGPAGVGCSVLQANGVTTIQCGLTSATINLCPFTVCHHETIGIFGLAWWGHGVTTCIQTQTDHDYHVGQGDADGECKE
jgi:hypothetical protein